MGAPTNQIGYIMFKSTVEKKICELCGIVAKICLLFSKVAVVGQIFPIGMFQCLVRSSSLSVKAEAALAEAGRCNSGSRLPVRVFYFLLKKTARQRHQAAASKESRTHST